MKIFLVGNGESRKDFDLESLRSQGKIYGCNALYRDFTPDVLISVDHGIMHEIYHSGYCYKNECWFRDWTRLPDYMYENLVYTGMTKEQIEESKKWDVKTENKRGKCNEFVMHGANLWGMVTILKNDNTKYKKNVNQSVLKVSWVGDDKVNNINDVMPNNVDMGWAAGPTSGYVATQKDSPTEIYLIGHDLNSNTKFVNNVYKDTVHYSMSKNQAIVSENWITQWALLFTQNPHIKFYKVNRNLKGAENTDKPVFEWNGIPNLEYIDYPGMLDKFN